jgi:hypothetical protein
MSRRVCGVVDPSFVTFVSFMSSVLYSNLIIPSNFSSIVFRM